MKTLQNIFTIVTLVMGMSMTQVLSEETQDNLTQKTIDAQIKALDQKIATSKGREKIKFFREKQALEEQKTQAILASKDAEIEEENRKQQEEKKKQKAYDRINETLKSIQGTLSSQDTMDKK